ncbi:pyridoxamine 5'-phosphate oxidase family protein [Zavarzinia sp. CC-PAN008]|uniref:pyridoxamine 5'-phosphate oxidase family protein n=1 Tax=Zavarzinia sp. CC-PAN008 TaxID=3243332 RepID=UPI003F74A392
MSQLYGAPHRALQDRFGTRPLADALEATIVHDHLTDAEIAFVQGRDMVFLATQDADGRPTVSYKGGAPGFIQVLDPRTLALPSYDGNGMYYSMGNIAAHAEVGLLFIDFETPNRLRLQGRAELVTDGPLLARFPGADLVVRIALDQVFVNCARYVHRYDRVATSAAVPAADGSVPLATWKRIDVIQPVLPPRDQGRPEREGGLISGAEYEARLARGET